jgi:hypothetical protein
VPRPKFTQRRERRFLALLDAGASVAEAARAVQLSRMTIYRHAQADPLFAHHLELARIRLPGPPVELDDHWRETAAFLKQTAPERWALPTFDIDPPA